MFKCFHKGIPNQFTLIEEKKTSFNISFVKYLLLLVPFFVKYLTNIKVKVELNFKRSKKMVFSFKQMILTQYDFPNLYIIDYTLEINFALKKPA